MRSQQQNVSRGGRSEVDSETARSMYYDDPVMLAEQWASTPAAQDAEEDDGAARPVNSGPGPNSAASSWVEYVGSTAALEEPLPAPRRHREAGGALPEQQPRHRGGSMPPGASTDGRELQYRQHGDPRVRGSSKRGLGGSGTISVTDLAAWGEGASAALGGASAALAAAWPLVQERAPTDYSGGSDWHSRVEGYWPSADQLTARVGSPRTFAASGMLPTPMSTGAPQHGRFLAPAASARSTGMAPVNSMQMGNFVAAPSTLAIDPRACLRSQAELVAILQEISGLARETQQQEEAERRRCFEDMRASRAEIETMEDVIEKLRGDHFRQERIEAELRASLDKAESRSSMYEGSISTLVPQLRAARAAAQAAAAQAAAVHGSQVLGSARGSQPSTARSMGPSESTTRRLFTSPRSHEDDSHGSLGQAEEQHHSARSEAPSESSRIAELRRQLQREAERVKEERAAALQMQLQYEQALAERDEELERTRVQLERVEESLRELAAEAPAAAAAGAAEAEAAAAEQLVEHLRTELAHTEEAAESMRDHFQSALEDAHVQLLEKDAQLQQRASELFRRNSQVTERSSTTPRAAGDLSTELDRSGCEDQSLQQAANGIACLEDLRRQLEACELFPDEFGEIAPSAVLSTLLEAEQPPTLPTLSAVAALGAWPLSTLTRQQPSPMQSELLQQPMLAAPPHASQRWAPSPQRTPQWSPRSGQSSSVMVLGAMRSAFDWSSEPSQLPPEVSPSRGAGCRQRSTGSQRSVGSAPISRGEAVVFASPLGAHAAVSAASSPGPHALLPPSLEGEAAISWLAEGLRVQDAVRMLNGRRSLSQSQSRSRSQGLLCSRARSSDLQDLNGST